MDSRLTICGLALVAMLNAPALALASNTYTMTLLPANTGAGMINRSGHVVLSTNTGAAIWTPTSYTIVGGIDSGYSDGAAINRDDEVAGTSYPDGVSRAFVYSDGAIQDIGAALTGFSRSYAQGINDAGRVVGGAYDAVGVEGVPDGATRAYIYHDGVVQILGTLGGARSRAVAINKRGVVVGTSWLACATPEYELSHAFLYRHGVMIDLGSLPGFGGSVAMDVNDKEQVVGSAHDFSRQDSRGFLYSGGEMIDIGTLGGNMATPTDINNEGSIVGFSFTGENETRGFLYRDGEMVDLNTLVVDPEGWLIGSASGINDRGQISASACRGGTDCRAVVLNPVRRSPHDAAAAPGERGARPAM